VLINDARREAFRMVPETCPLVGEAIDRFIAQAATDLWHQRTGLHDWCESEFAADIDRNRSVLLRMYRIKPWPSGKL
jgi:hypothetical protein